MGSTDRELSETVQERKVREIKGLGAELDRKLVLLKVRIGG